MTQNTNLPRRVQQELANAEALEAQLARGEPADPTTARSVDDLVAPAPAAPAPTTSVAQPTAAQPAAPEPTRADPFEHKYRVLQGMYEADVKKLRDQLREVTNVVQQLRTAPPQQQQAPQIDPKDIETFGKDLVEMVQRRVEVQQAAFSQRLDVIEQRLGLVAQQTALTREQQFWKDLRGLVPDFAAINEREDWKTWLGAVDPLFGFPRQQALDRAQQAHDANRVADFFKAFLIQLPKPPEQPTLDAQVTPQGAGNPPPAPPQPAQFITEKAIEDFYADLRRGKYVGKDEEFQRKEAAINKAIAEGRVVKRG